VDFRAKFPLRATRASAKALAPSPLERIQLSPAKTMKNDHHWGVRRVAIRVLVEAARFAFAILVGYGCAIALESTCPAPTPENSSPGCEGPSYLIGGLVGFVGTIVLTVSAQRVWRRKRKRRFVKPS
jgi:hypothetical protein